MALLLLPLLLLLPIMLLRRCRASEGGKVAPWSCHLQMDSRPLIPLEMRWASNADRACRLRRERRWPSARADDLAGHYFCLSPRNKLSLVLLRKHVAHRTAAPLLL